MRVFAESPMQMRRDAEMRARPRSARQPRPLNKPRIDPDARPVLDRANFVAYLRTGR
jgi:hypothetical protein